MNYIRCFFGGNTKRPGYKKSLAAKRESRLRASSDERLSQRYAQAERRADANITNNTVYYGAIRERNRIDMERVRRSVEASPYASLYQRVNSSDDPHYSVSIQRVLSEPDKAVIASTNESTSYEIRGNEVTTRVIGYSYGNRARGSGKNSVRTRQFDSASAAVAFVDSQLKRRGAQRG